MAEIGFHTTFYSFGKKGFDPMNWKGYFLEYDPKEWNSEGGGAIQFFSQSGKRYSLTIIHVPNRGFVLQLDCRVLREARRAWCKYAAKSPGAHMDFEELDEGLVYPVACILPPPSAWLAVEDFLLNPVQPSPRVKWLSEEDIEWPG